MADNLPRRGLVLGKFMPLHRGHELLFSFARQCCQELTIAVDCLAGQETSASTRARHVHAAAGFARVAALPSPMPQEPSEHSQFWDVWRDALAEACGGEPPDVLIASMAYGKPLARALGCAFVPFDFERSTLSLCATDIRQAPFERWGAISAPARELYVRRLCIAGPESTGKSTAAAALASELSTIHVPEYAKTLIASNEGAFSRDDAMRAALGQIRSEQSALAATGPLMVLDSDPLTTLAWTITLFGSAPPELEELCRAYPKPDATLLFDPHLPWSSDIHRQIDPQSGSDASRMAFFQLSQNILARFGRDFEVASGTHADRRAQALALSRRLLAQGPRAPAALWEPAAAAAPATKTPSR